MGNRGPLPASVPFEQLVGQTDIFEQIEAAKAEALRGTAEAVTRLFQAAEEAGADLAQFKEDAA